MQFEDWRQAACDLETGVCLWIGAGVTKHLARSVKGDVPDWGGLTNDLERAAGLEADGQATRSNPERLDACAENLGIDVFRRTVSRRIYGDLCLQLARFAHGERGGFGEPPDVAWQLGALGWLANPIVNFNVETLTSHLIARPGGPCRILPYRDRCRSGDEQEPSGNFARVVYHPHGAVNYSGAAVMTASEYRRHAGSLAYLLAVSAAFENDLWICGMSLDDAYLRNHLEQHRDQIRNVRWFDAPSALAKHAAWALRARITAVAVDWKEFWTRVQADLGPQVRRSGVMTAWFHVLDTAITEVTRGSPRQQWEDLAAEHPELEVPTRSPDTSYRAVFDRNEAKPLLPEHFDAAAISSEIDSAIERESALVARMQALLRKHGHDDLSRALDTERPHRLQVRHMNV